MNDIYMIPFDTLESFMAEVFENAGAEKEVSKIVANVLIESDKRGIESHGVGRFKPIYMDRIEDGTLFPGAKYELVKDSMATAVFDANHGFGHVVSKMAMETAIEKAKIYGLGMAVVRNSTHYGIAGYYASMATNAGCIGITGTNARPSIAPTFGVENMLGTNPITFGIPTDEKFDFLLDCATSTSQRGKIEVYDRAEKDIPSGWVIDRQGNNRTEIEGLLNGLSKGELALTPLGGVGEETAGFKGYGYATVVEILSAALQGGAFLKALSGISLTGEKQLFRLGHFFIAIDISKFIELDEFRKTTGDILRELRASEKMPGQSRIYTAGEKEYLYYEDNKDTGVPVNKKLQEQILEMKRKYKLDNYKFSFEK